MIDRSGINSIIRLIHTIVREELLRFSRGSGGTGAPPIPPEIMKNHPLDPDAGPHTGTLPEDEVVFEGTGHPHSGGAGGKKVTAADVVNVPAGGIAATDVQGALDELDSEKATLPVAEADVTFDDAAGHDHQGAGDTGKKVTAAKVINVPAGEIAATDVQAAIDELDSEKISDIEIQEDDVKVADAVVVNFEGGGGKVTDEGGGKVTVDITPGGDGDGGEHIHAYKEDKSAECDGVKVTFITAQQFEPYTLRVFHERLEQVDGMVDFAEGAMYDHFDMVAAPDPGDKLIVHYLAQRV